MIARPLLLALALGAPALAADPAAELDCGNAVTQVEMTGCAHLAWEAADAALNEAYAEARAALRLHGEPAAGFLRDAQRAWITFRDLACTAEVQPYAGGTIQSMLYANCLERLTLRRTEDLRLLARPQ